jgi:hypothetical protein
LIEEQVIEPRVTYHLNRFQLRDDDYPSVKPPGSLRVLILGDSFTFGSSVSSEAIFPQLLEGRFNEGFEYPGVSTIEILNGGIPGSQTHHWVQLYEEVRSDFEPDVLLIVFFLRDGTLTTSIGGFFEPIREQIVEKNRDSALYRHFYLSRLYTDHKDRRFVAKNYTSTINRSYLGSDDETVEWENSKTNLLEIVERAGEAAAVVGLVIFPVLFEMQDDYPFEAVCDEIAAFARENDIPVHNLLDAFRGHDGPELWISALDQHPNATAHAIAAESMLPFVDRLIREKVGKRESEAAPSPPRARRGHGPESIGKTS